MSAMSDAGGMVGPYRVLREIGKGGMGVVYLAIRADDEYRKRVAIKFIPLGMDAESILARFRRERQILASLEHPNICHLLDGGTTAEGRPYFVMEYVEGQPIDSYCDTLKLSTTERLKLFRQVCAAVQYAHQNLVVHRDIKPGNIMVDAGGTPKLLDFGIAKLTNPDLYSELGAQTVAVARAMTPDYASPEQIRGLPVTTASDVYSLGVLLYELLTGHRPYQTVEPVGLQERERIICEQDPERPSKVVTQPCVVPGPTGGGATSFSPEQISRTREGAPDKLRRRLAGDLDNIVLMAMRKEPQRRYASADQFSEDLRRHLEGLPVLARNDTPGYRLMKFLTRHRVGVAAVTVVLLTLSGGILATTRQARIAERRFQEVRKLANSVVFELHDAIRDLPGSTAARKLLVQRSLEYLDRLAQEAGNDTNLQLELAAAYHKVGDVQGNPYQANLGDAKGALQNYRKSLAIREKAAAAAPLDWKVQAALARSYSSIGDMAASTKVAQALEYYRKAAAITSAPAHPADNEALGQLASDLNRVGEMQWATGDTAGAFASYGKSREALEELVRTEPTNQKAQRNLSVAYNKIGFAMASLADPAAALENFEKGRAIRERLAAADPVNASIQRDLWVSYNAAADVLGNPNLENLGRPAEALAYYRMALTLAETLAAADANNIRARRDIGLSLTRIADVLLATGDLPNALSNYRKAAALTESLLLADPANNDLRRDQGIGLDLLARALAAAGDNKGALDYFNRALSLQQKLAQADAKSVVARQDWLGTVLHAGDLLMVTRNFEAAGKHFRQGREEAEKMLAAAPASAPALRPAANFAEKLGDYHGTLAANKAMPVEERKTHAQQADTLYRRAASLCGELQKLGKLTTGDKKSMEKLAHKLVAN